MSDQKQSILIISGVRGDTRRYRTFHLYEQARLAGLDCQLAHITDRNLQPKVQQAHLVILHRTFYTPLVDWIIKDVHQRGGLLIQDIDDLLFEPDVFRYIDSPDFSDPMRSSLYIEEMHLYHQTVEACDVIIAATDYLAERVKRLGKPVWVHRNAFSLEMLDISRKALKSRRGMDERIVIGYASGTATHNHDFSLTKPALFSGMQKFANTELWLVGPLDPGKAWGSMGDRVHRLKKVPWRDLPAILAQFDINLAPLRLDNPFGQSKSEIKYVEAALVKVPTIGSSSEAFKHAIRSTFNGFLADNNKEWEQQLEKLIYEPRLRRETGEIAFQDVLKHYHPLVRARELVETLSAIGGRKITSTILNQPDNEVAEPTQEYWSSARLEKSPSLLQMARYSLRQRGFRVLTRQIRVYIRRWLSPVFPYRKHE